jgi:hypothetical protein
MTGDVDISSYGAAARDRSIPALNARRPTNAFRDLELQLSVGASTLSGVVQAPAIDGFFEKSTVGRALTLSGLTKAV